MNATQQQAFNNTLFGYLLLTLVLSFSASCLFYLYFIKKVVIPIRKLAGYTEKLIRGEFPDSLTIKNENEISMLMNNFNDLSRKLKEIEESRQRLVDDTAHELRTPLSNINGYLEGLKKGVIDGEPELYDALHKESTRLIHLVDDLYKLSEWEIVSSVTGVQKQNQNIKSIIQQCVKLFEWELEEKEIKVLVEVEERSIPLDSDAIQQVIFNLLQNAIQYRTHSSPITMKGKVDEKNYIVSVQTEGCPIPPEEKTKIFERKQRSDSAHQLRDGEGIGLAIVREIVCQHGGNAGLYTQGRSHTFWFTLPVSS